MTAINSFIEETPEAIIYRGRVITKEKPYSYSDGVFVKTADELVKADELSKDDVLFLYDGHDTKRVIGFALSPKDGHSFDKGQKAVIRDIFFDKESLTPEEMDILRRPEKLFASGSDLSIGYRCFDDTSVNRWLDQQVDGYSRDIVFDHLVWVKGGTGRCSYEEGCGLLRGDSLIDDQTFHYDSLMGELSTNSNEERQSTNTDATDYDSKCVGRKIKIFKKEHPSWSDDKVKAAAINYCKRLATSRKTDSLTGEKQMVNDNELLVKKVVDSLHEDIIRLVDHRMKEVLTTNRGDCDCQEGVKSTGQEKRTDSQGLVGESKNVSESSSMTSPTTGSATLTTTTEAGAEAMATATSMAEGQTKEQLAVDLSVIDKLVKANEGLQGQVSALLDKFSSLEKELSTIKEATKKRKTSYSMKDYEEYLKKNKDSIKKAIIV